MEVLLAKSYDGNKQNPTGWWMSEKLDGVRSVWDGETFTSRNGNVFQAPDWFIDSMPKGVILDGELWEGRGLFQKTIGTVRSHKGKKDWSGVKFMIFDIINNHEDFESRICNLTFMDFPEQCQVVEQIKCLSREHLSEFEGGVLLIGGEGVMLRKPRSMYEQKRSSTLLKVKRNKSDEAEVIGHEEGLGRNEGRLGALVCTFQGKLFNIGTGLSDAQREAPPKIGALVTFSYFELTDAGIPRFPAFVAERNYE